MNRVTSISAVTIWLAIAANPLRAVCLDPKDPTLETYYHPSLEEEVGASEAIVVVTVLDVQALSEASSDPGGWTSFIYKVRVEEPISGHAPTEIILRAPNDSGGYRMSQGESHLLFLRRIGDQYRADACGNSTVLPRGSQILQNLRVFLAKSRHAVRPVAGGDVPWSTRLASLGDFGAGSPLNSDPLHGSGIVEERR